MSSTTTGPENQPPVGHSETKQNKQAKEISFDDVFNDENEFILKSESRKRSGVEDDKLRGLAFSGGGIRSASFAMGVMQALVGDDKLKKFDYLSTVSGGGFTGSALTWSLNQDEGAGTSPANFPLGKKRTGARIKQKQQTEAGGGNSRLDFIRQHGNYLFPTSALDAVSFGTYVLRSIITSLLVYLVLMTVLACVCIRIQTPLTVWADHAGYPGMKYGLLIWFGMLLLVFYAVMFIALSPFMRFTGSTPYNRSITQQSWMGGTWKLALTLFVVGSVPLALGMLKGIINEWYVASGGSVFGTLSGIWQYQKQRSNEESSGAVSGIVVYVAVFALLYGLMMLAYLIGRQLIDVHFPETNFWLLISGLLVVALLFGLSLNINYVGPHQLWRSRIMETFMADKQAVRNNQWSKANEADKALMQEMCVSPNERPYHLVNTNLILVNAKQVKYRGRGGDSFFVSPKYTGSDATGWIETKRFVNTGMRGITLASAIAASAAALNPNAAPSGAGITRGRMTSILLAVLNLRLGFWTTNPKVNKTIAPPGFLIPGFKDEVMMAGLNEDSSNIQLSDGGHFENLAIYELIRRKVKLIVICDGGNDTGFVFEDLANAVEKARVDFGAKISFRNTHSIDALLPGTASPTENLNKDFISRFAIATRGYAIADVYYDNKETGLLIYVKPTMIESLPADVYGYKGLNPTFPQESTADQMFSEAQFEAYRELGYQIGFNMLRDKDVAAAL